ncbi:MAG TPA: O-antigen ligase family protein [Candidatus Methylomirabilis sp.]|nr:O-antigen ligase family protein [Candidatus Methylomirabilis sp.]
MTTLNLFTVLIALVAVGLIVARPIIGLYVLTACVVLIEARPLKIPVLTDLLYVYHWPPELAGRGERPIGLLILVTLASVIAHRLRRRERALEGGPLLGPFAFLLLCVAWGIVRGWAAGGIFKIIVLEVRPFWYLFVAYLLAYNLVSSTRHVRTVLWVIILGAGVKALQGLYIYVVVLHGHLELHHEIMAHEESFFLAAAILLFVLFFLHHRPYGQYDASLQFLPLMVVVLIANQRRAAYAALLAGSVVVWTLAFIAAAPQGRARLRTIMRLAVPLFVGYVLAFSTDAAFIARPARALVSLIYPDPLDKVATDSGLYRSIENRALVFTAMQHPLLGWGFGRQFLQPLTVPDISATDRYYLYIPHNTIYWVWMRLGIVGFLALWYLFGAIAARGALIAKHVRDPYRQGIAIFVVAVSIMELVVAAADLQLSALRNVLYVGLLAGLLMRLPTCEGDVVSAAARHEDLTARS